MPATLTIRDETASGKTLHEFMLEVLTERISVRELIRSRVYQEVQDFNRRQPDRYEGLVQPQDDEPVGGSSLRKKRRTINWQKQFERAVEAFGTGQILILVGDHQCESLDEEIVVSPGTTIHFLKLTLLVGG